MTPDEKPQFTEVIADVMAYYGREMTPFLLGIFWDGLRRFEFADVSRALSVHAQDPDRGQYAPRLADITRLLEGSTQTQGMRAWSKVERAIRSVGQYQSVAFDDPLIHAVIDGMGGWCALCATSVEQLSFRAREFERSYAAYRLRRETPSFPPRLIGRAEAENRMRGYAIAPPVLIGDPAKAARVMELGSDEPALRITHAASVAELAVKRIGSEKAA